MRALVLLMVACQPDPTETTNLEPAGPTTSTLPVPPTFDIWTCPSPLVEPDDAWILRNVYVDAGDELASIAVMMDSHLDPYQHTNCPVSGNETSCSQGAYVSATGVTVTYQRVTSEDETGAETLVVDASLSSASWTLDWHSDWLQVVEGDVTDTDESWSLSWTGKPLTTLPADTSLEATSYASFGGDFDVNAASWSWGSCAWSVLDQRQRATDGNLYEISVNDTAVDIVLDAGRWLGYVDGACVGEVSTLTWAVTGPC